MGKIEGQRYDEFYICNRELEGKIRDKFKILFSLRYNSAISSQQPYTMYKIGQNTFLYDYHNCTQLRNDKAATFKRL